MIEMEDVLTEALAFAVVTAASIGVAVVGSYWLDEKLRRHYENECERCR